MGLLLDLAGELLVVCGHLLYLLSRFALLGFVLVIHIDAKLDRRQSMPLLPNCEAKTQQHHMTAPNDAMAR